MACPSVHGARRDIQTMKKHYRITIDQIRDTGPVWIIENSDPAFDDVIDYMMAWSLTELLRTVCDLSAKGHTVSHYDEEVTS